TQGGAGGGRVPWSYPVHIGGLLGRAQVRLWVAMAIEAPAHAELFLLVDDFHLVHTAVARHTANAARHMRAVVEVDVVGQVVHFDPFHWIARGRAFTHREEFCALWKHERMAIHTRRGGRDGCMGSLIHGVVAIAAVEPQLTRMEGMAVGDRLLRLVADICRFG